jgi:hypothetical protein
MKWVEFRDLTLVESRSLSFWSLAAESWMHSSANCMWEWKLIIITTTEVFPEAKIRYIFSVPPHLFPFLFSSPYFQALDRDTLYESQIPCLVQISSGHGYCSCSSIVKPHCKTVHVHKPAASDRYGTRLESSPPNKESMNHDQLVLYQGRGVYLPYNKFLFWHMSD